jgi:chromosome segregation ATPase
MLEGNTMAEERTKRPVNVTFRDYVESKIHSLATQIDLRFKDLENQLHSVKDSGKQDLESVKESTKLAKESMEKRLDGMNEFRQTLKDQTSIFVTLSDHQALEQKLDIEVTNIRREFTDKLTKIDDCIDSLNTSRAKMEGKASQNAVILSTLVSVAGLALAIVAIIWS